MKGILQGIGLERLASVASSAKVEHLRAPADV